jgi:hypothetical protein
VFGRELKADEAPLPGDIVQFDKAKFVAKNGSWSEMPLHTAVVAKVDGTKVDLLHQNWNNSRQVSRLRINLADLTKGKVTIFRPQASQ